MSRFILTKDGVTVYDSGAEVVDPPPPPPVDIPAPTATQVMRQKSDWPAWLPGGAPNTTNAPVLSFPAGTEVAIKFNAADLLAPGTQVGNFSVYECSTMALCIASAPWFHAPVSGMNASTLCLSGKDGIKFAAFNHPATDAQLAASGYKRLPEGNTLYVNLRPLNGVPLAFIPLYGY